MTKEVHPQDGKNYVAQQKQSTNLEYVAEGQNERFVNDLQFVDGFYNTKETTKSVIDVEETEVTQAAK